MKYIHVHIPKTAGIFIKTLLRINPTEPNIIIPFENSNIFQSCCGKRKDIDPFTIEHQSISFIKENLKNIDFSNYNFFSIIRNPYSRIHSMWKFLKNKNGSIEQLPVVEDTFSEFLFSLKDNKYSGIFFLSQCKYLNEDLDKTIIFKLEEIEKIKKFLEENNIRWLDKKINESKGPDYKSEYTDELKKIVEDIYEEDIETYKYNFEN